MLAVESMGQTVLGLPCPDSNDILGDALDKIAQVAPECLHPFVMPLRNPSPAKVAAASCVELKE